MKTKYVKIAVADRLPEEGGTFDSNLGEVFYNKFRERFEHNEKGIDLFPDYWLEEVPDHEEEMLEEIKKLVKALKVVSPYRVSGKLTDHAEQLIKEVTKINQES